MNVAWQKTYDKDGPDVFDEGTQTTFMRVSEKYRREYMPFFATLAESTKSATFSKALVKGAEDAIFIADTLAAVTVTRVPQSVIMDMALCFTNITKLIRTVKDKSMTDKGIKKALDRIRAQSKNLDINDMTGSHTAAMGLVANAEGDKQTKWQQFEKAAPMTAGMTQTMGKIALLGLLGPMAPLAMGAYALGRDMFKGVRGMIRGRGQSLGVAEMDKFSAVSGNRREFFDRGNKGSPLDSIFGRRGQSNSGGGARPSGEAPGRSEVRFPGSGAVGGAGLFEFFNKEAYKAKYTNEVIELLRKIEKHTKKFSKAKQGDDIAWIPMLITALPTILATLGVISAAALQIAAFLKIKDVAGENMGLAAAAGPSTMVSNFAAKASQEMKKKGFLEGMKSTANWAVEDVKFGLKNMFGKKTDPSADISGSSTGVTGAVKRSQVTAIPPAKASDKELKTVLNKLSTSIDGMNKKEATSAAKAPAGLTYRDVRHSGDSLNEKLEDYGSSSGHS